MRETEKRKIISILKNDGLVIFPTDTLYGILGSVFSKKTVKKIYEIKKRNLKKSLIILISSLDDIKKFEINIDSELKKFLEKNWPGKISVIFPCKNKKFSYLHRGNNSLAFRFPKKKSLLEIIKKTGPLVAPSANFEGEKPAETITQAKKYFGNQIDFYFSEGIKKSLPSTLVAIENGKVIIKRKGAEKL